MGQLSKVCLRGQLGDGETAGDLRTQKAFVRATVGVIALTCITAQQQCLASDDPRLVLWRHALSQDGHKRVEEPANTSPSGST